jgi:hypothetical protein
VRLLLLAPPVVLNRLPERPKMRFEVGKKYRFNTTKDKGYNTTVLWADEKNALVEHDSGGRYIFDQITADPRWKEYKEPVVRVCYINMYESGYSPSYHTREEANFFANPARIACQKITLTEGTWDD